MSKTKRHSPAAEAHLSMRLLLEAFPESAVHRNSLGQTPLHMLLQHHAESRAVETIQLFTQPVDRQTWITHAQIALPIISIGGTDNLNKKKNNKKDDAIIPYSAISIADSIHGSYPLFYAVTRGANKEVIEYLLEQHPIRQALTDHSGRTALHWYLNSNPTLSIRHKHPIQPTTKATDWFRNRKSNGIFSLLTTPQVARMQDTIHGNTPLHSAASILALAHHVLTGTTTTTTTNNTNTTGQGRKPIVSWKSFLKLVIANPNALMMQNKKGQTPLHAFFATVHHWNQLEYREILTLVIDKKMNIQQEYLMTNIVQQQFQPHAFHPSLSIVQVLIYGQSSKTTSKKGIRISTNDYMEDDYYDNDDDDSSDYDDPDDAYDTAAIMTTMIHKKHPTSDTHKHNNNNNVSSNHDSKLPTEIADQYGMHPLHWAMLTVVPSDITEELISSHPSGMIQTTLSNVQEDILSLLPLETKLLHHNHNHTTTTTTNNNTSLKFGGKTPLHLALSSPYTSQLHTVDTIEPLLRHQEKQSMFLFHYSQQNNNNPRNQKKEKECTSDDDAAVDGTLALRMKDDGHNHPLHLAAERTVSFDLLKKLYQTFPKAAFTKNLDNDLPIHLLLDKYGLFDNLELASLQQQLQQQQQQPPSSSSQQKQPPQKSDPFSNEVYAKMVALAKKQHSTNRLTSLGLGGAVMAPARGWTSDDDAASQTKESLHKLQKLHLLLHPLCQQQESSILTTVSQSRQHMTPLHIAIAFHCLPYTDIHTMLQTCPRIAHFRTETTRNNNNNKHQGWTPLDLHMWRKKISGEVRPEENDCWEAIYQLLLSYQLFPLSSSIDNLTYRTDYVVLTKFAKTIRREIQGKSTIHTHPPVDQTHIQLGFPTTSIERQSPENNNKKNQFLGDVMERFWTFFVCFTNESNAHDNYAVYVQAILKELDFEFVQKLIYRKLPDYAARVTHTGEYTTLLDAANAYSKQIIYKFFYFAGLYDFTPTTQGDSILLHRGSNEKSLLLRATEINCTTTEEENDHIITTKDSNQNNFIPQMSQSQDYYENNDEGMEIEVSTSVEKLERNKNFKITKKGVCIKFMKDETCYQSEVNIRSILGDTKNEFIVPILADYNATTSTREGDKQYAHDIQADRFNKLALYASFNNDKLDVIGGYKYLDDPLQQNLSVTSSLSWGVSCSSHPQSNETSYRLGQEWISLSSFPYSVAMPLGTRSLKDVLEHDKVNNMESFREISRTVGRSLEFMHSKGVMHGSFSMNNVLSVPTNSDKKPYNWLLTGLTSSKTIWNKSDDNGISSPSKNYCGGIPTSGEISFDISTFPPEMFTKLGPFKIEMYEKYWNHVSTHFPNAKIPWSLVKPYVHPSTGDKYVMKCFCELNASEREAHSLPPLPYDLVPCSEAQDMWAFGLFVFSLCSGGQSVLNSNIRNGQLDSSSWERIVTWDINSAEHLIFKHVDDLVAQDILLHILVDIRERHDLSMSAILSHPFFLKLERMSDGMKQALYHIRDQREAERLKRQEESENATRNERESLWLQQNTTVLSRLTLESQMTLANSTTELLKEALNCAKTAPTFPTCLIVLPYKLGRNKGGKLTPITKKDVQLAEIIGKQVFHLNKTCYLSYKFEELMRSKEDEFKSILEKWVKLSKVDNEVTIKEISEFFNLDKKSFGQVLSSLVCIISSSEDKFLANPILSCQAIIRESIENFISTFVDAQRFYFYLVDELSGIPVTPRNDATETKTVYPFTIVKDIHQTILYLLPFMYISTMQMRKATRSTGGLVRLIFEAAYPHTPPSWAAASKGLIHDLSRHQIVSEIRLLCQVINGMMPNADSDDPSKNEDDNIEKFYVVKEFIENIDKDKTYSGLRYVTDNKAVLWTSDSQVEKFQNEGDLSNLIDVYKKDQMTKEQMKAKDLKIIELENTLKELKLQSNIDEVDD